MNLSTNKYLIYWLLSGCFLVFAMVIVGGITRLTGSGLSITEWNVVTGTIPPLNEVQWNKEFEKYKQIPQYKLVNTDFTLRDFKFIYFWEYIHRLIGRLIGIVFIIPFLYFWRKKQIDKVLMPKLIIMFLLGAWQGFLGWYMVKSGLTQNIHVSHLRLALHLINAFVTFGYIFWVVLGLIFPSDASNVGKRRNFKSLALSFLTVVTIQIIYGAFVAGTKAGYVYNTYPKMGDEWIASSISFALQKDGISSLINNLATVQFIHRWFAFVVIGLIVYIYYTMRKHAATSEKIEAVHYCGKAVVLQILLGIFTLIYAVPVWLGVVHQVGAFLLFACSIYLLFQCSSSKANANFNSAIS